MGIFELFTGKKGALIQLLVAILCILQVVVGDLAFGFGCFDSTFGCNLDSDSVLGCK